MSAITAMKKHGVPKSSIAFMAQHLQIVPPQYRDCFSSYYLLYWNGAHTAASIKDGTLEHNGITYQIQYYKCSPFIVRRSEQVKLSFRAPATEFALPAIVIISIPQELKDTSKP